METFGLGLLILTSEASDAIWSSRPHSWHVGIHQIRFPECGSGPPATTSGEACEINMHFPGPASDLLGA